MSKTTKINLILLFILQILFLLLQFITTNEIYKAVYQISWAIMICTSFIITSISELKKDE